MEWPQTFVISQQAIDDGKRLGLTGDVEAQILEMARRSAILTYPGANRRFKDFAMHIQDQVVLSLQPFDKAINKRALGDKKAAKRRARREQRRDEL